MAALPMVVMLPEPSDAGTPGGGRAWPVLEEALRLLVARNGLGLERLPAGSENALKRRLMQSPFDILHFVGCGSSRSAVCAGRGNGREVDCSGRSRPHRHPRRHPAARAVFVAVGDVPRDGGIAEAREISAARRRRSVQRHPATRAPGAARGKSRGARVHGACEVDQRNGDERPATGAAGGLAAAPAFSGARRSARRCRVS